eukprot:2028630-Pyramimonas_sp.AAC.1
MACRQGRRCDTLSRSSRPYVHQEGTRCVDTHQRSCPGRRGDEGNTGREGESDNPENRSTYRGPWN